MVVTVRTLRRNLADYADRAARGESIVVLRHGHPWAMLRRPLPGERCRAASVTAFRQDLRGGLLRERRTPVALTWRGRPLDVVVCAVPAEYVLEEEEDLL
jgi:antitoxin (DNA-binding transcriptional repressor) of toxin-antitoxin stability system